MFYHERGKIGVPEAELSVVLVVSPLVSLTMDQVSSLLISGISAAILSGNLGVDKKCPANKGDIMTGWYRFLDSCPEAIAVRERLSQLLF